MANSAPQGVVPHNRIEQAVKGLRDYEPPHLTYKKFQLLPNGKEIFIGEVPVPELGKWNFNRSPLIAEKGNEDGL